MKTLFNVKLLPLLFLGISLLVTSCGEKDPPAPARDKFLGSFNANASCSGGLNLSFASTITESSTSDDAIVISNFGNFNVNVRATVSGENISFNDTQRGITFSGSGNISGNTLTIIYTASVAGERLECTKTCIKQ